MRVFGRGPGRGRKDRIDRHPQNLGVPLGGFRVVRKQHRVPPFRKWWRANGATVVAFAGAGLAVVGGVLSSTQPPVQVGRIGNGVGIRVGDMVLLPSGPDTFGNAPQPVLIIAPQPDGTTKAVSSGYIRGKPVSGVCLMRQIGVEINESCSFKLGADAPIRSTDSLDVTAGGLWHREYADHMTVVIQVPPNGAVIPVPFPIGR